MIVSELAEIGNGLRISLWNIDVIYSSENKLKPGI